MKFAPFLLALVVFLSGCASVELAAELVKQGVREEGPKDGDTGKPRPKAQPVYKVGDPYRIKGKWYYPERDMEYDETGIASWYGDEFADRLTANGEIFDPADVSAAHKTLPMPSVVRVTNLENGRELVVRVNDRGPFITGRIIDMSREGARLLGFEENGTARVRVRILATESLQLEQAARNGKFPGLTAIHTELPQNTPAAPATTSLSTTGGTASASTGGGGVSSIDLLRNSRTATTTQGKPVQTDIWIQVGAFGDLANANVMLRKLAAVGRGRVSTTRKGGQTLYRVRLGPIDQVPAADDMLGNLLALGYEGAHIVLE